MSGLSEKTIGFIGGGQMAEAIFGGLIAEGAVKPEAVTVTDVSSARLGDLAARFGIATIPNDPKTNAGAASLLTLCDIIIFSVKPQFLRPILDALAPHFAPTRHLVISIVGGAPLKLLEDSTGAPVIRVMPNTPMLVREGAAGIALGSRCTEAHSALAAEIFGRVGKTYLLPESLIDPLTSISGCGPAYAYMFIEALADGGVEQGLPRAVATELAAQTLAGAARMVLDGEHPARLKDSVCSPGGATIAGVHALERGRFRGAVMDAVEAGMRRMAEVGRSI